MGSAGDHFLSDMSLSRSHDSHETNDDQEPRNLAAAADDDQRPPKRVKFQRHTTEQINELENFFKDCPHPNEIQKHELSEKLGLEPKQIKFWFQNKRTQAKAQKERQAKDDLENKYERLRSETLSLKEKMKKTIHRESAPSSLGETPINNVQLRLENARLQNELIHARGMLEHFMARSTFETANSFSQHGLPFGGSHSIEEVQPHNPIALASSSSALGLVAGEHQNMVYLRMAATAMHELVVLGHKDSPFWYTSLDGGREKFDNQAYDKNFNQFGVNPYGFVFEATRATGLVVNNSQALVNSLMHPIHWAEMFPCMIGKVTVIEVLCSGVAGTHDGELLMMNAELVFPSPFVPRRQIRFIRYSYDISSMSFIRWLGWLFGGARIGVLVKQEDGRGRRR